ncbi:suppressor of fused homolog [Hetaerina americana]|uniref:suppressor of fused homolog n=1 Tax=Hetaerina americana TaxID=62018 RepID=UPI003A7F5378
MEEREKVIPRGIAQNVLPPTPLGLEALYSACKNLYPDQPNPLQVTALVKYWLGGPDPLDYISMYANPGVPEKDIPPHWHYISFGLSDLHGDGRVHDVSGPVVPGSPSGFGFELTFRAKREPEETAPPTWPAALMQALAKYVFNSENTLCVGDHVSWHCPLDGSESRIRHMLMAEDPQLNTPLETSFGCVKFVQIVGVCAEELKAAQRWNGPGVIEILRRLPGAGGPWLVTDMRRGETMFEIDISALEEVENGIETDGSNLSGVSARWCAWTEDTSFAMTASPTHSPSSMRSPSPSDSMYEKPLGKEIKKEPRSESPTWALQPPKISEPESRQIKEELQRGLDPKPAVPSVDRSFMKQGDAVDESTRLRGSYDRESAGAGLLESTELLRVRRLEGVHITLNLEAACILPLALRGRVKHGRHFTFKAALGDDAITLVAPSVTGTMVDAEFPYAAHGGWLQLLIDDQMVEKMGEAFDKLIKLSPECGIEPIESDTAENEMKMCLPQTFVWSEHKLAITVVPDKF